MQDPSPQSSYSGVVAIFPHIFELPPQQADLQAGDRNYSHVYGDVCRVYIAACTLSVPHTANTLPRCLEWRFLVARFACVKNHTDKRVDVHGVPKTQNNWCSERPIRLWWSFTVIARLKYQLLQSTCNYCKIQSSPMCAYAQIHILCHVQTSFDLHQQCFFNSPNYYHVPGGLAGDVFGPRLSLTGWPGLTINWS